MNFKEALEIVVNEAEVSALGERTDEHLRILKACEIVQEFLNCSGYNLHPNDIISIGQTDE